MGKKHKSPILKKNRRERYLDRDIERERERERGREREREREKEKNKVLPRFK